MIPVFCTRLKPRLPSYRPRFLWNSVDARSRRLLNRCGNRLKAPLPALREAAAEALGKIGDPSVGRDLVTLFADRSQPDSVRDTAAYALGRLTYREALPELLSALADPAPTVRSCAAAALAAIGDGNIRDRVKIALETEQVPKVRTAMKQLLASLHKHARPGSFVSASQYAFDFAQREYNRSPEAMRVLFVSYSEKNRPYPESSQIIDSPKAVQSQTIPSAILTSYVSRQAHEYPSHPTTQHQP
jgi:hypothetical protein